MACAWSGRRRAGRPPPAGEPACRGFGSRLLASLMERQLGGRLTLEWRPEGLRAVVWLPARHLVARPPPPGAAAAATVAPVAAAP